VVIKVAWVADTVADEWVAVVDLYHSVLVTGSADLKAVGITTLRRMLAV
jgi:hypothetical protein